MCKTVGIEGLFSNTKYIYIRLSSALTQKSTDKNFEKVVMLKAGIIFIYLLFGKNIIVIY